jgi:SsrA-binding protein
MSILIVAENKKARFDYHILTTFEAGLQLTGSEVKSIRDRAVQLKDSYIAFKGKEAFLQNAHISEYKNSSYNNHAPERHRKLLLHRVELDKIAAALREKGQTCIALKIYFKDGKAKIEIALAKGKKAHDKREAIKTRDSKNEVRERLKKSQPR